MQDDPTPTGKHHRPWTEVKEDLGITTAQWAVIPPERKFYVKPWWLVAASVAVVIAAGATVAALSTKPRLVLEQPKQETITRTPSPTTVLILKASGTQKTKKFDVDESWEVRWSYDCRTPERQGNFVATVMDGEIPIEVVADEPARSGFGTSPMHVYGTYHLAVVSPCRKWTVKVIDTP